MKKKLRRVLSVLLCAVLLIGAAPALMPAINEAHAAEMSGPPGVDPEKYSYAEVVDFTSLEELQTLLRGYDDASGINVRFRLTNEIYMTENDLMRKATYFYMINIEGVKNSTFIIDLNGHNITFYQTTENDDECRLFDGLIIYASRTKNVKLIFTDTSLTGGGKLQYSCYTYSNGPANALKVFIGEGDSEAVFEGGTYALRSKYTKFNTSVGSKWSLGLPTWGIYNHGAYTESAVCVFDGKCTINDGRFITAAVDNESSGKDSNVDAYKYGYLSNISLMNHNGGQVTDLTINGGLFQSSRYNIFLNSYSISPKDTWGFDESGNVERLPKINGGYFCGYAAGNAKYSGGGICLSGTNEYAYNVPRYDETKTIPVSKLIGRDCFLLIDGKLKNPAKVDFEDIARQDKILVISDKQTDSSRSTPTVDPKSSFTDVTVEPGKYLAFFNTAEPLPYWVPKEDVSLRTYTAIFNEEQTEIVAQEEGSSYAYKGKESGTVEYVYLQLNLYDKDKVYVCGDTQKYRVTNYQPTVSELMDQLPVFTESPGNQILVNGTGDIRINWKTNKPLGDETSLFLYASNDGGKTYSSVIRIRDEKNLGEYIYKMRDTDCKDSTKRWFRLQTQTSINSQWRYTYSEPFTVTWTEDGEAPYLGRGVYYMGGFNGENLKLSIPFNFGEKRSVYNTGDSQVIYRLSNEKGGVRFNHSYDRENRMLDLDLYYDDFYKDSTQHFTLLVSNRTYSNTAYRPGIGVYTVDIYVTWYSEHVTVSFYPADGSGSMKSIIVEKGNKVTLPECGFTPPAGKVFSHWEMQWAGNDSKYDVYPGDTMAPNSNVFVTAVWQYDPNLPKFSDVDPGAYYADAVNWAVANGITSGTSATTFSPEAVCTRAQVVTFLWRAAGQPEPSVSNNPFTDVKSSEYYYKPVLWAIENGITSGISSTQFGPNSPCTRAQVVTFQWRAAGKPAPNSTANPFTDVKSGEYFYDAVLWAVENKITSGMSATTFAPEQSCTRGQIVTFLYRQYK